MPKIKPITFIFEVLIINLFILNLFEGEKDVCSLPPLEGGPLFCRALHTKYYYKDAKSGCVTFIYGGCGGNGNRFNTEEECLARCGPRA